ncbi:MAG: class I SAM-dependent methyltransferase [Pyrinomonadaceae bacterium]|nr:class I SAM-dependent methyltransferase [Pyrinomonadaceae bacterium]
MVNYDFTSASRLGDLGRWFVNGFVREVGREEPAGSLILDAGAGEAVYRKYFSRCRYESVDLAVGDEEWNYNELDYVAPLDDLPMANERYDAVLCTQVLEHLERPRESVCEFHRVLKPGGRLYLTAPMAHVEHQVPFDFFRYTSFGLRSIVAEAGFEEIEIAPFGGMFTRWAYELPRALAIFPPLRSPSGRIQFSGLCLLPAKLFALILVRVCQAVLLLLEPFDKVKNDPFGWSLRAVRK